MFDACSLHILGYLLYYYTNSILLFFGKIKKWPNNLFKKMRRNLSAFCAEVVPMKWCFVQRAF